MRVRMLALVLGTAALSLGSVAAFADEGGWRHEQCEELRGRYERERARTPT